MILLLALFQILTFVSNQKTSGNDSTFIGVTDTTMLLPSAGISLAMTDSQYDKMAHRLSVYKNFSGISEKPNPLPVDAKYGFNSNNRSPGRSNRQSKRRLYRRD